MTRVASIPLALVAAAFSASGLMSHAAAQTTSTQRLEFDDSVVHTDPIAMNFAPVPAAASQIISATLRVHVNQSSLPDELQALDSSVPAWVSLRDVGSSGWQMYQAPMDSRHNQDLAAGLSARLVVNFIFTYQGTQIDYAELTVVYESCLADLDDNGFVNGDDFDGFMDAFYYGTIEADFDANTFVNGDDFDGFMAAFFVGC